jgi:hypothetical protein
LNNKCRQFGQKISKLTIFLVIERVKTEFVEHNSVVQDTKILDANIYNIDGRYNYPLIKAMVLESLKIVREDKINLTSLSKLVNCNKSIF